MLSIGVGLMCAPRMLMLDEPTLGLSPKLKDELADAIGAISAAGIVMENGKPVLRLELSERIDDFFVETAGPAYFHAPRFSGDGRTAWLPVSNVADPAKLAGTELRLTYVAGGKGYEQTVRIG